MNKRIIYIGSQENGGFLLNLQNTMPTIQIEFAGEFANVQEAAQRMLDYPKEIYIVDTTQFLDNSDEIAEQIKNTVSALNGQAIILAPGHTRRTTLSQEFITRDIHYFIFGMTTGSQIKELEKILPDLIECEKSPYGTSRGNPCDSENSEEEIPSINVLTELAAVVPIVIPKISVGIAGSMERIGTTTQALQIVKYLQYKGKKVVFIQMNQGCYIEAMKQVYAEIDTMEDHESIQYQGVKMVPERQLGHVLKEDYEYYIYDYSNMSSPGFNRASFLEKDVQIVVCGSSPTELSQVIPVLTNPIYENVYFIFSFVDTNEQVSVLDMMQERREKTFFAAYAPDPFLYTPQMQTTYDLLIPAQPEVIQNEEKRPKRFFPFFKK